MVLLTIMLGAIAIVLVPETALAWGPATHLELGRAVIHDTAHLVAPIKALIDAYAFDFLYGNVAADIVVAKGLMDEKDHCHNWDVGFRVLDRAGTDSERAFAYGYLAHLAADTVGHNYFIPEMMLRSYSARITRHIYWELRFDALADRRVWELPDHIERGVHEGNDRLLNSVIVGTPLPFRTNKHVFSSIMNLHRVEGWHRMIGLLGKRSRWAIGRADKDRWFAVTLEAVMELLNEGRSAPCVADDPTAKRNLALAVKGRRALVVASRRGADMEAALEAEIAKLGAFTRQPARERRSIG